MYLSILYTLILFCVGGCTFKKDGASAQQTCDSVSSSASIDGLHEQPTLLAHESDCTHDDDCILVNKECCGCMNDGARTAMNKNFFAALQQRRKKSCLGRICYPSVNNHPFCRSKRARCVQKICIPEIP